MIPTDVINWQGLWTLYCKEVRRFLKVYNQTLLAPMVNALLLLAVFSLALGDRVKLIGDIPFHLFMASGLVIMSIVQQSFANTSSSFIMGKVLGTLIDYLMPPITAGEMLFAMIMAGITRGFVIGTIVMLSVTFFIDITIHDWGLLIFYIFSASMMLSLLGVIAGIFAETFDHMSAITSYVITPLSFLSGTFYSVKQLPELWYYISQFNPFFYMIDGFRYSMTGYNDGSLMVGIITLIVINITLWTMAHSLIARGYRIKS